MNGKIIIANWKMNLPILSEWGKIKGLDGVEIVICPPFTHIGTLTKLLKGRNIKLGSQDCFWENQGAYTGEISPLMLKNLGVEYVIVGHSERRNYFSETDEMIAKKTKAVIENGLTPILCIGETLEQRKRGLAKEIIKKQLERDLKNSKFLILNSKFRNHIVIAYEPVWAIGTGNYCQPKEALEMIKFIKYFLNSKFHILKSRVIYGGSVDSKNIRDFLKYPEIEGALVGGASIKIKEFQKIINEVSKPTKTKSAPK